MKFSDFKENVSSEVAIWREATRRAIAERRPADVKEIAAELRAQAKAAKETAIEFAQDTVRAVKGAKKSMVEAASSLGEAKEEIAEWASERKPRFEKGWVRRAFASLKQRLKDLRESTRGFKGDVREAFENLRDDVGDKVRDGSKDIAKRTRIRR
jgi:hypothetical protein